MKFKSDEIASVVREEIGRYRDELSQAGSLKLRSGELADVIRQEIAKRRSEIDVAHAGRVLEVGDGIAQIYGLSGAMAGEMLEFESGQMGQVFNLEDSSIGAVIYGDCEDIQAGHSVRGTGKLLSVPVGPRDDRPRGGPAGQAAGRHGRGGDHADASAGDARAGHRRPPARQRAACRPASRPSTR